MKSVGLIFLWAIIESQFYLPGEEPPPAPATGFYHNGMAPPSPVMDEWHMPSHMQPPVQPPVASPVSPYTYASPSNTPGASPRSEPSPTSHNANSQAYAADSSFGFVMPETPVPQDYANSGFYHTPEVSPFSQSFVPYQAQQAHYPSQFYQDHAAMPLPQQATGYEYSQNHMRSSQPPPQPSYNYQHMPGAQQNMSSSVQPSYEYTDPAANPLAMVQVSSGRESHSQSYSDITEYLNMPQTKAAKLLGIPTSTLSKRWKESAPSRKWPWRTVKKIDSEIVGILRGIPPGGEIPLENRDKLALLIRQRREELRPVVIRF